MIFSYGISNIGSSHIKSEKPNQDAKKTVMLKNDTMIVAIADGVGSCKFSDIASKIAVNVSTEFCENNIKNNFGNQPLEKIIEEAFAQAEIAIEKQSLKDNQPLPEYDTTLDLVIYDGNCVSYGHCGDGGIIGLTEKGDYIKITSPQKKEGTYVVPLRNGAGNKNNTWVFGHTKEIAGVFLATDGVYDQFFPYLLKGQPSEIYVPLARYFMDNNELKISQKTINAISVEREKYTNSGAWSKVTDDKTFVVLINGDKMPEIKEASYYEEPDWAKLQQEWEKKAYPHLYEKKEGRSDKKDTKDMPVVYKGKKKPKYEINPHPFSDGGEANIHNINGQPQMAAKIYKTAKMSKNLEDKIKFMVNNPLDQKVLNQFSWPIDILYDTNGEFAGYVMPKLTESECLDAIYEYGAAAKYMNISWELKITIGRNICILLESLHKNKHCVGDFSPHSMSVDPQTGSVSFFDTDSYHIQDMNNVYRCVVGIPEYLPVEMHKSFNLATAPLPTFTEDTDNFALAIHIFRLLMNGCHPFACARKGNDPDVQIPNQADNIMNGNFLFMRDIPDLGTPLYAPSIDILSPKIKVLFKRAFIDGHKCPNVRPKPEDWRIALDELKRHTSRCKKVKHHLFYSPFSFKNIISIKNLSCPWCEIDGRYYDNISPESNQNKIPVIFDEKSIKAYVREKEIRSGTKVLSGTNVKYENKRE